jgi:hypothetical protein
MLLTERKRLIGELDEQVKFSLPQPSGMAGLIEAQSASPNVYGEDGVFSYQHHE